MDKDIFHHMIRKSWLIPTGLWSCNLGEMLATGELMIKENTRSFLVETKKAKMKPNSNSEFTPIKTSNSAKKTKTKAVSSKWKTNLFLLILTKNPSMKLLSCYQKTILIDINSNSCLKYSLKLHLHNFCITAFVLWKNHMFHKEDFTKKILPFRNLLISQPKVYD